MPLDTDLALHGAVSFPAFVAQPVALILLGLALRARHRGLGWSGLAAGVISLVGAATFVVRSTSASGGLFERLALWPSYVWVTAAGAIVLWFSGRTAGPRT